MQTFHEMKNLKRHSSSITLSVAVVLLAMYLLSALFPRGPVRNGGSGIVERYEEGPVPMVQEEADIVGFKDEEDHIPAAPREDFVIFEDDFNDVAIDPDVWAYHILRAGAGIDHRSINNPVLQIGHVDEWAGVVLMKGGDWRDYIVEMDVKILEAVVDQDVFFLGVRYDRNAGEYALSLNLTGQMAMLGSTIDGRWQGISHQAPLELYPGVWYRLEARVEGDTIDFFMDDVHAGSIKDDTLAAGSLRMLTPPGGLVHVDNVVVKEIPSAPEPGDLLVTEFLFRDHGLQWFEVLNGSNRYIKLDGIQITNGSETHEMSGGPLVMAPRSYKVLTSQNSPSYFPPGSRPYVFGDALRFPADNGYLGLLADGQTITEIAYSEDTGWLLQDEISIALHPDYLTPRRQNNGFHWCPSVNRLSDGSPIRATPGNLNHVCVRELPINDYGNRQSGELVITEIMIDLPGPDQGREWFEVYNPGDSTLSLKGLTIATDNPTERHTITEEFNIPSHSYAILAQAGLLDSELPDDLPIYYYPGQLGLRNNSGELVLHDGGRVIDRVTWRDNGWWAFREGVSMSLHPDASSAYSNDDALNWCLGWTPIAGNPVLSGTPGKVNDVCPMWEINSPLQDTARAYEGLTLTPIPMHVTVDPSDLERMKANPFSNMEYPVRFRADGYDAGEGGNATMRPRGGNFTRVANIQSYTIRLEEPFQGQSTLALNKHNGDLSRLRNALSFRLFQGMDDMVSLRTQFVHLFVNGEDFGLFTMIESRGSQTLRNHRLDDRGHLFNIEYGFFLYDGYDRTRRIESILDRAELQVGRNHNGMIEMMDTVYSGQDTHQVIDRHFNRENLLTYFASVYLMQNPDTRAKNYLLYSTPREPQRFYFIPWDWDLAFFPRENRDFFVGYWREGFGNWMGMGIMDRMLREPELVDALIFKMVELAQTSLSQERVNTLADQLAAEVEPFTRRPPDLNAITSAGLAAEVEIIKSVIADSASQLVRFIERPLPVSVGEVSYDTENNAVTFVWGESLSLQDRPLTYEVVLFDGSRWDEENIVWRSPRTSGKFTTITQADIPDDVNAGSYYWMVYVWDDKGNYNTSYNMDEFGIIFNVVDLP
jgi:spore coat protein H